MRAITSISGSAALGITPTGHRPHASNMSVETPQDTIREGRALVPVAPVRSSTAVSSTGRPDMAFLAQLIATRDGVPQTRERRRAEPDDVHAAYAASVRACAGTSRTPFTLTA